MIAADLFVQVAPSHAKSADWRDALANALTALPDEQSEVVVLKIYGEFTFQDIAAITATSSRFMSVGSVEEMLLILRGQDPKNLANPGYRAQRGQP